MIATAGLSQVISFNAVNSTFSEVRARYEILIFSSEYDFLAPDTELMNIIIL